MAGVNTDTQECFDEIKSFQHRRDNLLLKQKQGAKINERDYNWLCKQIEIWQKKHMKVCGK
jgi:hypothetical protein